MSLPPARCATCRHFAAAGGPVEAALPGLRTMSSAFADSRGDDGICRRHDLLLRATASCPEHQPS
ncbi:hypothetical protein FHR90_002961 [Endobacter medicaginis]|uniref:Uncharacterized protein n=1 Tax=Endobacter medicaginis TaxID=1181271 RepID=A0A839V6C7_9PROT|nr:hypothetical protein [Endobacter medicaginis]MBB3175112.1 hypothetical protein [Endobacter medicaginis]MCX5476427.1 hypothetical protein [Endobacter medicaginis]NVN31125.1 hypothetical protein [Endobacter medicaginis]